MIGVADNAIAGSGSGPVVSHRDRPTVPPTIPAASAKSGFQTAWPYIRGAALSVTLIWVLVITYMSLTPRMYASQFTLNVPGASNQSSFALESIGQVSSTTTSPFATTALSPKVVYREIANSEQVRTAAATALGMTERQFGRPRVKLIDETALMLFEVAGTTPEDATRRAEALIVAFNKQLEKLRTNEIEMREAAVRQNLAGYEDAVRLVRDQQRQTQQNSGLHSLGQYNELVTATTVLRRRITDLEGETQRLDNEHASLKSRLGLSPAEADAALKIASSPQIQKALAELSDSQSLLATDKERYGTNHPSLMATRNRYEAARNALDAQLSTLGLGSGPSLSNILITMNGAHRAELLQSLVRTESAASGKRREIAALRSERVNLETDVDRLAPAAARLEDLKKDQIVADAVLSSAMTRINASRSDVYGSYPIVQVVAAPDRNEYISQPRLFFAALGGISGSLFACLAWILAWLQFVHRARHRKSMLSTTP